jgi:predicted transcriptional regulator
MKSHIWESKENLKDKEPVLNALGRIVGAFLQNNVVEQTGIAPLIQQVYSTLCNLQNAPSMLTPPQAPVDIEKSVTNKYLVCLESGKKFRMLRRHLRTSYGMTPEQYRQRWGLPPDYPMVAPDYAKKRSELARSNGLGRQRAGSNSDEIIGNEDAA